MGGVRPGAVLAAVLSGLWLLGCSDSGNPNTGAEGTAGTDDGEGSSGHGASGSGGRGGAGGTGSGDGGSGMGGSQADAAGSGSGGSQADAGNAGRGGQGGEGGSGSSCTPSGDDDDCDGQDDDCDGQDDERYTGHGTDCGVGACARTGSTSCVGGDEQDSCAVGSAADDDDTCDGADDDCSGASDEDYTPHPTQCGVGACGRTGVSACVGGDEQDSCAPGSPAADDDTCDGQDDDCSGSPDEDYVSVTSHCGQGVCARTGATSCVGGNEQQNCSAGSPLAASDTTCDGQDDDCSGSPDEDYVVQDTSCGEGACRRTGVTSCVNADELDSCTEGPPLSTTDTTCDGRDDDCDGQDDEEYAVRDTSCGRGVCLRTGTTSCVGGGELDGCTPGVPPAQTDTTCNGVDEDCSGAPDEDYVSVATDCGTGACVRTGSTSCVNGSPIDSCSPGAATVGDITCDGQDDDCDAQNDEDYIGCFDGTTVGSCEDGAVVGSFSCSDGIACTEDACVAETGSCDFAPENALCTDDGFSCTHELCVANVGCQTISIDTGCPDALFCNGSEVCDPARTPDAPGSGADGCAPALPASWPCADTQDVDGIACTDTVCVEDGASSGHCASQANHENCDDGEFCNGAETCTATSSTNGGCTDAANPCAPAPACAVQTCDELDGCGAAPNPSYNCGDGDPCTLDVCDADADTAVNPTGCVSTAIPGCTGCGSDADCQDNFACTLDACQNNTCTTDDSTCECFSDAECNDGVACTVDTCTVAGQCVNQPSNTFCSTNPSAGDPLGACDGVDVCDPDNASNHAIGCVYDALPPIVCDDGLECTFDNCDPDRGCTYEAYDPFCAALDPIACDGRSFCNPASNPQLNPTGCQAPATPVVCPDDGIACTQGLCLEPNGQCVQVPSDAYCIAQPGGCGSTCRAGVGCVRSCNISTCQGKTYECGDCLDNDGDCRIDSGVDAECLGPCQNNEDGYAGEIPGQNNAPCKMDCYFDQDTGSGNDDCYWSHACDPLSVAPGYPPSGDNKCDYSPNANIPGTQLSCAGAQAQQSTDCWDATPGASPSTTGTDYCGNLVPNGCDCFGCCEIPGLNYAVYLGSTDAAGNGSCTTATLTNPALCKPCTQVQACRNRCDTCEICVGRPLPPACNGCQVCPPGQQRCGTSCGAPCPTGSFCLTGCCVQNPE